MRIRSLKLTALLCWLAPACQTEGPAQPALYARLARSCAPFDGPAVTLYLSDHPIEAAVPSPPYRMISVYRAVDDVLGHSFTLENSAQLGSASNCVTESDCRPSVTTSVSFGALGSDSIVKVSYRFDTLSGSVSPRLDPTPAFCG